MLAFTDALVESARSRPKNPAVYYFNSIITFEQLNEMVDALSTLLKDKFGVEKGDRIAVNLLNIPQFVISAWAALRIGAVTVPLDIMPAVTLEYHLMDSGAKVLITQQSTYLDTASSIVDKTSVEYTITTSELDFLNDDAPKPSVLAYIERKIVPNTFDFLDVLKKYQGKKPRKCVLNKKDLAMLCYTSGTTGSPKGVMLTYDNIMSTWKTYPKNEAYGLTSKDCILAVSPLTRIIGLTSYMLLSTYLGIPLVLLYRFNPELAIQMIDKAKVTFVASVTSGFVSMKRALKSSKFPPSLRRLVQGGMALQPAFVEEFEKSTGLYIHNAYGLTEASGLVTCTPEGTRTPVDKDTKVLSIGRALPGFDVFIVDSETGETEVPTGELGEIAIRGPCIMKGYWNKPDENRKVFKKGWLLTGDVGRRDEAGWFYILDRKKDIINTAGWKVGPTEVERVLYEHPAVLEACVIGIPDTVRGEVVKAFIVLRNKLKETPTEEEIISFCKKQLPSYKCPRKVEFIDEMPKSAIGKPLRRLLIQRSLI